MMDKKTYLEELSRYFNSVRDKNYKDEVIKSPTKCCGVSCRNCIFKGEGNITCIFSLKNIFDALEILEKWSKEHPESKYKVSKMEYDVIKLYFLNYYSIKNDYTTFSDFPFLKRLIDLGHFKNADYTTDIEDYLKNCEVVEE